MYVVACGVLCVSWNISGLDKLFTKDVLLEIQDNI